MKELKLSSWEDFEAEIPSLFEESKKIEDAKKMRVFGPLFRGHANASCKLETTLERSTGRQYGMLEYHDVMRAVKPTVESFTERSWNLSDREEKIPPPSYDFMIYLRHHGFPSPLLDWTHSPYVAAFFAFQPKDTDDDSVAIYSYLAYSWTEIALDHDKARIELLGPYVTTHKRHYTQQSWYTICCKQLGDGYVYCSHEEAIEGNSSGQGSVRKYVIPRSERSKVLDKLYLMNINSYSLFGDEESLMKTLAYQEIERKSL